jgi:glycosyltransferase involved in cell wall biosynthesis
MAVSVLVGLLTNEYPTEPFFAGGLASYLQRVAEGLAGLGHSVEIFVTAPDSEHYELNGVRVNRVTFTDDWSRRSVGRTMLWRTQGFASTVERCLALRAAVTRHRDRPFDLIQAPDYLAPGLLLALEGRIPVVTRVSHYAPLWDAAYGREATRARQQLYAAERHQLRCSCAVYGPSAFLAQKVGLATGVEVKVIPPPYDATRTMAVASRGRTRSDLAETPYAMFFGTIGLLKGADRIVDVLPAVLKACPDMTFVFAGHVSSGRDGRAFSDIVGSDLQEFLPRVRVLPALRHEELWPLVSGSRFVVLPSRFDNLPNACLEAMALSKPVIATKEASFDELLETGVSGELVPQDNVDALGEAMIRYWRMPQAELDRIGCAAKQALGRLAPEKVLPPLESLYSQVIQQHREGRCARHARGVFSLATEQALLSAKAGAVVAAICQQ